MSKKRFTDEQTTFALRQAMADLHCSIVRKTSIEALDMMDNLAASLAAGEIKKAARLSSAAWSLGLAVATGTELRRMEMVVPYY